MSKLSADSLSPQQETMTERPPERRSIMAVTEYLLEHSRAIDVSGLSVRMALLEILCKNIGSLYPSRVRMREALQMNTVEK